MAVESVAGWPWNGWPDQRGISGRMRVEWVAEWAWNTHTSESTLHVLALVGGWPGALIAQNRLRHKSKKQPFRAVFWATVVMNCAAFIWLFTQEGARAWQLVVSAIV
jgi:hypothetical protein